MHKGLLTGRKLREAWPEEMRSAPEPFWKESAASWHFVNVERGGTYEASDKEPRGDLHVALTAFESVLRGERLAGDSPIRRGLEAYPGDIDDPANRAALEAFALEKCVGIDGQRLQIELPREITGRLGEASILRGQPLVLMHLEGGETGQRNQAR